MIKKRLITDPFARFLSYLVCLLLAMPGVFGQTVSTSVIINTAQQFQTMEGFGASLAYYEGWLTAHPNKSQIYDAIFNELSLDILRVRNAYGYDDGMIGRVKEFADAAEQSLGHPIAILSTSWGPPAMLKSNNDRTHGGTLRYTTGQSGVEFDYAGFADWWSASLDAYNAAGIYPTYISIQNEPDFNADWESCRLNPTETINVSDTIAGYNKALEAVYNMVLQRDGQPFLIGPEVVGVGYNTFQNYVNALKTSFLHGLAHHLYHGVDVNDPWASTDILNAGKLHPEIPHFQSEFSGGDWFSLSGLLYKTLREEGVAAYLYWDLIWDGGGLVALDFPWDPNQWIDKTKGYTKTKEFYVFKQFSAYIHPGWIRVAGSSPQDDLKAVIFVSPDIDAVSIVLINKSLSKNFKAAIQLDRYQIDTADVYRTSDTEDGVYLGALSGDTVLLPPHSVTTIAAQISIPDAVDGSMQQFQDFSVYPNPISNRATLRFSLERGGFTRLIIMDSRGRQMRTDLLGKLDPGLNEYTFLTGELTPGLYFFSIESGDYHSAVGKFIICQD